MNYISDDGRWDAVIGGGANRYDGDHFGEIIWMQYAGNTNIRDRYYDNVAVKDDFNLFAKATYEVSNGLFLYGDLQGRWIDYTFQGINNDLRDISGETSFPFSTLNLALATSLLRENHCMPPTQWPIENLSEGILQIH